MKRKERLKRKFLGNGTEKYHRNDHRNDHRKLSAKSISENYQRKALALPSILSRQNVLTYRNTSYLKISRSIAHFLR